MINIFGIQLHIYGLLIGLGVWVAWEISLKVATKKGIPGNIIDSTAWWMIAGGIIGARVYHVIDLWQRYYSYQPIKVFYLWEGGLAIWGAIIGGVLGVALHQIINNKLYKLNRINILDIVDCVVVGLPLAQAIGRLGNWVNGELPGKNGEPLFAYEAILNVLLFILLWKLSNKKRNLGFLTGVYLIGYGSIRMVLENFRPDTIIWKIWNIPVAVMFGALAVITGIFLIKQKKWRHIASTSKKKK